MSAVRSSAPSPSSCAGVSAKRQVRRPAAVVRAVAGAGQALGVALDEEQPGAAAGDRADHEPVGAGAVRHRLLDAGEPPAAAVLGRLHGRRRRAPPAARLGVGEDEHAAAPGHGGEHLRALLRGADGGDETAGEHDRLDEGFGREHLAQLLGHERDLDRAGAHATVVLGEGQSEDAHLGQPRPGLLVEARVGRRRPRGAGSPSLGAGQQAAHGVAEGDLLARRR